MALGSKPLNLKFEQKHLKRLRIDFFLGLLMFCVQEYFFFLSLSLKHPFFSLLRFHLASSLMPPFIVSIVIIFILLTIV